MIAPRTATTIAFGLGLLFVAGQTLAGTGSTTLVATKKLTLKDNGTADDFKTKIVIKDPAIDPSSLNPTAGGAEMYFYSSARADHSAAIELPAGGWTAKGTGFTYKDKSTNKTTVKLKPGKLVFKNTGPAMDYALMGQPVSGAVSYRFTFNVNDYVCGLVPGMDGTIKKDDPDKGVYVGKKSEAPAGCPSFID